MLLPNIKIHFLNLVTCWEGSWSALQQKFQWLSHICTNWIKSLSNHTQTLDMSIYPFSSNHNVWAWCFSSRHSLIDRINITCCSGAICRFRFGWYFVCGCACTIWGNMTCTVCYGVRKVQPQGRDSEDRRERMTPRRWPWDRHTVLATSNKNNLYQKKI